MKKLKENMEQFFDEVDKRWLALPIRKQRLYTLYFFASYLLMTIGIIAKVCYEVRRSESKMNIEHIDNPVLKKNENATIFQDTSRNFKKQNNEKY